MVLLGTTSVKIQNRWTVHFNVAIVEDQSLPTTNHQRTHTKKDEMRKTLLALLMTKAMREACCVCLYNAKRTKADDLNLILAQTGARCL